MKFKVGDKVKLINNRCMSANSIGDEGVITEIKEGEGEVYIEPPMRVLVEGKEEYNDDKINWSWESDLELIKEK